MLCAQEAAEIIKRWRAEAYEIKIAGPGISIKYEPRLI